MITKKYWLLAKSAGWEAVRERDQSNEARKQNLHMPTYKQRLPNGTQANLSDEKLKLIGWVKKKNTWKRKN